MGTYLMRERERDMNIRQYLKVAVVEDDRDINELVCYNLLKNGYKPTSIFDGSEAQDAFAHEHFDVVVLDLMLPGLDGIALCSQIKQQPQAFQPYVIVLTARINPSDRMRAYLAGADRYMTKPFCIDALLEAVECPRVLFSKRSTDKTGWDVIG